MGVGIASNNVEYFDEPALAVMLLELPTRPVPRVLWCGAAWGWGLRRTPRWCMPTASTPDVAELIEELAARTDSGYVFGGLSSSRGQAVQFAVSGDGNVKGQGAASGVFSGGLSGVAFGPEVDAGVTRDARLFADQPGAQGHQRRSQCGADAGRRDRAGGDAA